MSAIHCISTAGKARQVFYDLCQGFRQFICTFSAGTWNKGLWVQGPSTNLVNNPPTPFYRATAAFLSICLVHTWTILRAKISIFSKWQGLERLQWQMNHLVWACKFQVKAQIRPWLFGPRWGKNVEEMCSGLNNEDGLIVLCFKPIASLTVIVLLKACTCGEKSRT